MLLIKGESDLDKHKTDLELWGGVVLQAEPTKQINDKVNNDLYTKESRTRNLAIGLASFAVLFILLPLIYSFSWISVALLITTIAGTTVGYFLLAKEMGVTYEAIDTFCNAGKNTNCDKVLKADINLFGINFSEATATYFIFQLVAISFVQALPTIRETFLQVLAILSILTLPIILFSLYYQYAVVKTWCKLCLIVVGVLIVQLVIFSIAYLNGSLPLFNSLSLAQLATLALLFLTIGFFVVMLKSIIEMENKLNQLVGNGNRVKYSPSVFIQLLVQQNKIDSTPFEKEMLLGSPHAPIKIIMVSNLYCNPCKEKHKVVEELMTMYPDKVSVALRFVRSKDDTVNGLNAGSYLVGAWLTHCYGKAHEGKNTTALVHDWFEFWDLQKFAKKYSSDKPQEETCKAIETQHYTWTQAAQVYLTPTFFVNGYQFPTEYSIDDMMAMIPALAEVSSNSKENKSVVALYNA